MNRRPVSTPVRALAALGYVVPVAIILLALPAYRQVRLVRVHCLASLILGLGSAILVLGLGSLRPGAFEFGLIVGVCISTVMVAYTGAAAWSAFRAYQGRAPAIPGVTVLAGRLERHLGPRPVE